MQHALLKLLVQNGGLQVWSYRELKTFPNNLYATSIHRHNYTPPPRRHRLTTTITTTTPSSQPAKSMFLSYYFSWGMRWKSNIWKSIIKYEHYPFESVKTNKWKLYSSLFSSVSFCIKSCSKAFISYQETYITTLYNGTMDWHYPAIMTSTCKVDVRYFPFDIQLCNLTFGPWSADVTQVIS